MKVLFNNSTSGLSDSIKSDTMCRREKYARTLNWMIFMNAENEMRSRGRVVQEVGQEGVQRARQGVQGLEQGREGGG